MQSFENFNKFLTSNQVILIASWKINDTNFSILWNILWNVKEIRVSVLNYCLDKLISWFDEFGRQVKWLKNDYFSASKDYRIHNEKFIKKIK